MQIYTHIRVSAAKINSPPWNSPWLFWLQWERFLETFQKLLKTTTLKAGRWLIWNRWWSRISGRQQPRLNDAGDVTRDFWKCDVEEEGDSSSSLPNLCVSHRDVISICVLFGSIIKSSTAVRREEKEMSPNYSSQNEILRQRARTHAYIASPLTMGRNRWISYLRARGIVRGSCARCKNCTREVVNLRHFIRDAASPMQIGGRETGVRTSREVKCQQIIRRIRVIAPLRNTRRSEIHDSPFARCRANNVIIIVRDTISFYFLSAPNDLLYLNIYFEFFQIFTLFAQLNSKAQNLIICIKSRDLF